MIKYKCESVTDKKIVLTSSGDLQNMISALKNNEDILLYWIEKNVKKSKLMIASSLYPKIQNEDVEICANEVQ